MFIPTHVELPTDNQLAVSSLGDFSSPTGVSSRQGATSFPRQHYPKLQSSSKLRQLLLVRHKHLIENGRREVSGGAQRGRARSRCKIRMSKTKWQCTECQVYLCARKLIGKESTCIVNHLESIRSSEFGSDPSP